MTSNSRNILHPLTISIPETKVVALLTDLNNQHIDKSFELDSVSQDSLNNVELLRLEIQHLKRQNTFLKRKIWEMQLGKTSPNVKAHKKQSLNCFNILKKNALLTAKDPKQNSLSCIFIEIQNILQSLASIHKLQINKHLWINSDLQIKDPTQLTLDQLSFNNSSKLKKQKMGRKLQMIALQKQQNRYEVLLEVFTDFYQFKSEEEARVKKRIETFIQKTLEIGKELIQSAANRSLSKSMRSSYMSNMQKTTNEPFSPCSGDKQNLSRIELRIKTQRQQMSQSTIMKLNPREEQNVCSSDKIIK